MVDALVSLLFVATVMAVYVPLSVVDVRIALVALFAGTAAQNVLVPLVFVPALGNSGSYVVLWKLALIALLIVAWRRVPDEPGNRVPPIVRIPFLLFLGVVLIYLVLPVEVQLSGVASSPLLARLEGAVRWLTPALIVVFGWEVARLGVGLQGFSKTLVGWAGVISAVALVAWIAVPPSAWVTLSQNVPQGAGSDSVGNIQAAGLTSYFFGSETSRGAAPFGSPLALAFFLALPTTLLLRLPFTRARLAIGTLIFAALLSTQTRGVILAVVFIELLRFLPRRLSGVLLMLSTAGLAYYVVGNGATFPDFTDPSALAHSVALRSDWVTFVTHPFGLGLGQGGVVGRTIGDASAGGENLYLVLGNEIGWLGLFLGVLLIGAVAYRLRTGGKVNAQNDSAPVIEAVLDCLKVFLLASMTTEHAVAFVSSLPFWLALGIGLRVSVQASENLPARVLANDGRNWARAHSLTNAES